MAELYWMALTRDVHFSKYGQDETTIAAAGMPTHATAVRWVYPRVHETEGTNMHFFPTSAYEPNQNYQKIRKKM